MANHRVFWCRPLFLYPMCIVTTVAVIILCVVVGSVNISFYDTVQVLWGAVTGNISPDIPPQTVAILINVRLPRVLTVALVGSALSLSGAAMQGLLKNPLADGSTLGVSSGASLGAVFSIALSFSVKIPFLHELRTAAMSMLFAFLSMAIILWMSHCIDYSLSTNTIILIGVIFSMFASSLTSLLITFAGEKVKTIMFWTMGSFAGCGVGDVALMALALLVCGCLLLRMAPELNAFAIGEDNARHVGVNVRRVKLTVIILVSAMIGVSVSISGMIGFVGLIIPHATRIFTGPNHKILLPVTMFFGAVFLMVADLASRMVFSPIELPIGVITSLVGSVVFAIIFYHSRTRTTFLTKQKKGGNTKPH